MKKTFKKIISLILSVTVLFGIAAVGLSASAAITPGDTYIYTNDGYSGYRYTLLDNGEIEIETLYIPEDEFQVPESIDGYPVTRLVVPREMVLGTVYIPKTVKTVTGNFAEKFVVDEDNPYFSSDENGVLFDKNKETLVVYPAGSALKEYTVPSSVKRIGEEAFSYAVFLEKLFLNEGLTVVDLYAFEHTMSLKYVSVPSTVTNLEESAFYFCDALEFIDVDENNPNYSSDEFGVLFDKEKVKLYKYPSCAPAESYVMPNSVKHIVFDWYGPTLRAFDNIQYLKELTISASMDLDMWSYYGFRDLEKLNVSSDNPNYTSIDGLIYSKDGTELKRYPGASKVTCFRYGENVTAESASSNNGFETSYLASVVYNEALSEYVTPINDGEEMYVLHEALSDVYYMGEGEPFERTTINTYSDRTVTFHYNCKPDDHFHDYQFEITTAPTCGKKGTATLTCSCGKVITTDVDNSGAHKMSEISDYPARYCSCKNVYYDVFFCEKCENYGVIKNVRYPEMNMLTKYDYATETEDGLTWSVCADCGEELENSYISAGNRTITIRINGIDFVDDYAPGEKIKIKCEPQKENAVFVGWVDREGNFVEFPEIMPDEDVYLEAVFENAPYNVTYINDGETVGETQVKYGDTVDLSFEPEKSGYNFIGWAYNGELVNEAFAMPGFDIILEAVWEAKEYTVTYTVASETVEQTYVYGDKIDSEIAIPDGYEFVKWTDENGVDAEIPETMPAEDLVFVAKLNAIRNNPLFDVHASFDDDCFGDKTGEVVMKVENTSGTADKGAVYVTEGVNYHQVASYQITMVTGENEEVIQPVNGKKVKIRIPIPDGYSENNTFEIIHRYSDKGREPITPVVVDGYLEFYTGHFSTFEVYVASGLSVSKMPDNINVIYKGKLNLDGIELTYINDNGEATKITDTTEITVRNFDSSKIGTQTVTIEYEGESAEIGITVSYAWWQWIIRIFLLGFIWY